MNCCDLESHSIAKFTCPQLFDILPRERLYERLYKQKNRPIKWVQGLPGSGKTTFVADYIKTYKISHLWYRIDEVDTDLTSFFNYLGLLVKKLKSKKTEPLPSFALEDKSNLSNFSRKFFQRFFTPLTHPITIIFDNYQVLPIDSDLHEVLCLAAEEIPAEVTIIFISRCLINPCFRRLQASNYIDVIGWNDLCFSESEFNDIIFTWSEKQLSNTILKRIHTETQGWVAGLMLILESCKTRGIKLSALDGFSFEEIFDYFAIESLSVINDQIKNFLYECAFLPEATVSMANQLSGKNDAEEIFNHLYYHQLFINKNNYSDPVYQFHPLFNDYLKSRAKQTFSKTRLREIKRKAAKILLNASYFENAIELIIDIKDWQWFERLIVELAPDLIKQGKNQLLIKWLSRIPEIFLYDNAWLLYWLGVAQIAFDPQISQDSFEIAFSLFRKKEETTGLFLTWSGIMNANIYKFKSSDSFLKWIPVINDLIETFPSFPSINVEAEVSNSLLAGLVLAGTNHYEIEKRIANFFELIGETDDTSLIRKKGVFLLSFYYTLQGNIFRSESLFNSVKDLEKKPESHIVCRIMSNHTKILNLFYSAKNQECIDFILINNEVSNTQGIQYGEVLLLGYAAAAALSNSDYDKAAGFLRKMKSKLVTGQNLDTFFYHIINAWFVFFTDPFFSLHLSLSALKLATEFGFSYLEHMALTAVAQICHELGHYDKAKKYLREAFQKARNTQNRLAEFKCYVIEVYFSFKEEDDERTAELLEKAMKIGQQQDAINFIFWRPSLMSSICAKALEFNIEKEYAKCLIKKRNLTIDATSQNIENWPWKVKIYTLGKFEVTIDNVPLLFSGKIQKTPLTILKILISLGCVDIREDQISDILWPDSTGDAGYRALVTTVQRLRRLINYKEAIVFKESKLSLNPHYCWVDIWALTNHLSLIRDQWKEFEKGGKINHIIRLTETLFEKFSLPFLPSDKNIQWTFSMRDRIKTQIIVALKQLAEYWEQQKTWKKALEIYQKCMEIENCSEELFQRQMICYQKLGCRAEVVTTFNRCQTELSIKLGIQPSYQTKAILDTVLKNGK